MAARNWTPEQRRRQAESLGPWNPCEQSTGPRTDEGKAAASHNGWKGGQREVLLELARALEHQRDVLAETWS